jgi:hypothetical protein
MRRRQRDRRDAVAVIPDRQPANPSIPPPPSASSPKHLVVAGATVLTAVPVAVISMLPETQFGSALPTALAVFVVMLGFAGLTLRPAYLRTRSTAAALVFAIFAMRLATALGIGRWWWWPQALAMKGTDWDVYELLGWDLAQSGLSIQALFHYPLNEVGVVYLVGILYSIVGRNPLVLSVVFTLLTGWIALTIGAIVDRISGQYAARRAAVLALLVPTAVLYGSMPTKDIVVALGLLRIVAQVQEAADSRWRAWAVVEIITWAIVLAITRATALLIAMVTLAALSMLEFPKVRLRIACAMLVVVGLGSLGLMAGRSLLGRPIDFSIVETSEILRARTGTAGGSLTEAGFVFARDEASSIALRTYWSGDWRRLYLVPIRAMMLMLAPFPPVDFTSLDQTFGSFTTVMVLLMLCPALNAFFSNRGRFSRDRAYRLAWLWLPLGVQLLALSVGVPFVATRYSLPAIFLFCGLAAIGFVRTRFLQIGYAILPYFTALLLLGYELVKQY